MKPSITRDTLKLTAVSFILQTIGLVLNTFISNRLGTVSVGIMSLIFSFFGFIMVLANGNIFTSASRIVSEEIGRGNPNPSKVMQLCLTFGLTLSIFFAAGSGILSEMLSEKVLKNPETGTAIRILALSLPLASAGSCIKGYFHAVRKVRIPCASDCIEFAVKNAVLTLGIVFTDISIYRILSVSILIGEFISCVFLTAEYIAEYRKFRKLAPHDRSVTKLSQFLKIAVPILISGYVQMIMSSINEALVPVMLLKYYGSSETALSEYGMFEAFIIPVIFYPSLVLSSLSVILVPEIAAAASSGNKKRVCRLTHKAMYKSFSFAFLIVGILICAGREIGSVFCSESLVGETLVRLAPVVPFIYLEIVMEGILKGLGKQNFSTLNSLAEYIIRISCVIIFVNLYGFTGVVISYYASNVISNIVRIHAVLNAVSMRFDIISYIVKPAVYSALCCQLSMLVMTILKIDHPKFGAAAFVSLCGLIFIAVDMLDEKYLCSECMPKKA